MLTGLLGNMSLLSYFVKKRETEVVVVQTLGVVSIYAVITQLAIAEAMPFPYFVVISAVVVSCLLVNFMKYFNFLNDGVWRLWEDFITIGGLSALPQVIRLYKYYMHLPNLLSNSLQSTWLLFIKISGYVVDIYTLCSKYYITGVSGFRFGSGCSCYGKSIHLLIVFYFF